MRGKKPAEVDEVRVSTRVSFCVLVALCRRLCADDTSVKYRDRRRGLMRTVLVIVASGRTFARDTSNTSIEKTTETVCVPAPTPTPPAIYARVKAAGRDMVRTDAFRPLLGAEFHGRKKPDISAEIH